MAPTSQQAQLVASLKAGRRRQPPIPIYTSDATVAGHLVPITHKLAEDAAIIDSLFRWRRDNMAAFLTNFAATPEKTKAYLTSMSLSDAARILFLLADGERFVGHMGLCNITADSAEIDNVVRGEVTSVSSFMVFAHIALLRWTFSNLNVPLVYLNVLADNIRAIRTYKRVGLVETSRTPLLRRETIDGYVLAPAVGVCQKPSDAMLIRMELQRDSFYREKLGNNDIWRDSLR
jgi:RimJ/RimL family protein N-acetyltransferase